MSETEANMAKLREVFGDFMTFTDERLFGEIWKRPGLSPRDRSLITVAVIAANCRPDPLRHHLQFALANGVTKEELKEALMHVAFYAGWPTAISAMQVATEILAEA